MDTDHLRLEESLIERSDWKARANCMGVDPDLFFPERGMSTREAKEVCRGCVVREDCLEYALANGEKFGIWGGLSERELQELVAGLEGAGDLFPVLRQLRPYLLEINASVLAGCLRATFVYSSNRHRQATVERLAQGFLGALRELIAGGLEAAPSARPTDFARVALTPQALDRIAAELELG